MIQNKEDLKRYLAADKRQLRIKKAHPSLFADEVWKFQIWLRRYEYYVNTRGGWVHSIAREFCHLMLHHWQIKLNFSIPVNVFDEGLCLPHYGTIVVNRNATVGKNCRLLEGTNIGAVSQGRSPKIGDNVFIATGAKVLGDIKIASNTIIGAGAVVVKDILEEGTTWVGVPAHKVEAKDKDKKECEP